MNLFQDWYINLLIVYVCTNGASIETLNLQLTVQGATSSSL
uniref:Uncharacterized protein n=1 Tax=Aegilops tauschii subsp. strangulata TaxID=200361 RepID=A0A453IG44_AEGTS